MSEDSDPNALWLTLAHTICSDMGIAQGHITDRLLELQKLVKPILPEKNPPPYHEIITYLNEKSGKHFKGVQTTKDKIKARWNEGYTLADFKHVIDTKCFQWVNDRDMCAYLRPETLFGTKFDSYLNEVSQTKSTLEEWQ